MSDLADHSIGFAGLAALDSANVRHAKASSALDLTAGYASLVEATWWVATLDQYLLGGHDRERYRSLREGDPDGQYVLGMVWARDRHYHQMPLTLAQDDTPFVGHGIPGAIFYIAGGFLWKQADDLPGPDRFHKSPPGSRERYVALLENQHTGQAGRRCARWFRKALDGAG